MTSIPWEMSKNMFFQHSTFAENPVSVHCHNYTFLFPKTILIKVHRLFKTSSIVCTCKVKALSVVKQADSKLLYCLCLIVLQKMNLSHNQNLCVFSMNCQIFKKYTVPRYTFCSFVRLYFGFDCRRFFLPPPPSFIFL